MEPGLEGRYRGRGVLRHLPRGHALPDDVWWRRHRGILTLLWLHIPVVVVVALVNGVPLAHAFLEAGAIGTFAAMATLAGRRHKRLSTVTTAVGLLTCSAVLVHLSDGLIEMHFHYFVMVGIVTLYQDWRPFLAAIGYVVLQHGVAGAISPEAVYNHPEAVADPWTWAGVHGLFVLSMSVAGIVTWRLNEQLLEAAGDRELKLAEAQELAQLGSWSYDIDRDELSWSAEMYRLYRVGPSFVPTAASVEALAHPDDVAAWHAGIGRYLRDGTQLALDFRIVLPDGEVRWMHSRGEHITKAGGGTVLTGTTQDVTDRHRSEDALRERESELRSTLGLLNATLDATADGILVVDLEGRITSSNLRFAEIWGIPAGVLETRDDDVALSHVVSKLVDPDGFLVKVKELYANPTAESHDTLQFADGRVVERYSKPQRVGGEVVGRVWSFRDVTERKRLEDELAHQAFHDPLTTLANQALFRDRVEHALVRTARSDAQLTVLFVDLDNFKTVNDSLGHVAGDELLVATATRLRGLLRPMDTAARLGGDEFAILLEDTDGSQEAAAVAERLLEAMRVPFEVAGREVVVGTSIGIAVGNADLSTDQLLRNADLAMYRAKGKGRGRFEIYAPEMHEAAIERLDLEADLRRVVERDELRLHYQPLIDIATGAMSGVEALLRWDHPGRGLTSPDVFIPVAEDIGVIDEIGVWVLNVACNQVRTWQLAHPRNPHPLCVSVNLSPRQLRDESLVAEVASALQTSGLAPECLTLEITEGAMMQDTEVALHRLQQLKELGVQLSVDDFGTGYSSLSYLQRFPIDELKIDRTFTQRIDQGPEESSLARAIVKLAHTLHLRAVAEGVETESQLAVLRILGCEHAQGFFLHRPLDADALGALLDRTDPARSLVPLT